MLCVQLYVHVWCRESTTKIHTTQLKSSSSVYPRCRKLPKALKEWQAFLDLKKKIDDFNECCPLLEMMANKAMMTRHWDRMATLTGHTFDVESDGFLLKNIMMAPLLENKEDIEVIIYTMMEYVRFYHSLIFFIQNPSLICQSIMVWIQEDDSAMLSYQWLVEFLCRQLGMVT